MLQHQSSPCIYLGFHQDEELEEAGEERREEPKPIERIPHVELSSRSGGGGGGGLCPGLHVGSKNTGKISIVFEDLSRNSFFFEPK